MGHNRYRIIQSGILRIKLYTPVGGIYNRGVDMSNVREFYFNTGVEPCMNKVKPTGGVNRGGVWQIPFRCADVPEGSTFKYACDTPDLEDPEHVIQREILEPNHMLSKYAYFLLPRRSQDPDERTQCPLCHTETSVAIAKKSDDNLQGQLKTCRNCGGIFQEV